MAIPKVIEAIRNMSGGASVQSDYNVNDTASMAHILNRPFYVTDTEAVVQMDEKFIPDEIARITDIQEYVDESILGGSW